MKAKIHVNVREKINSRNELKKLYLLIKKKKMEAKTVVHLKTMAKEHGLKGY